MKLGVVGSGNIVEALFKSLMKSDLKVEGLWCRNQDKGHGFEEKYGCAYFDTYEELLNSDIDTVYIGLVNSLHYEYAFKAIDSGKNVIVEKPFTSRYAECIDLIDFAEEKGVFIFEAIMSRYSKNYDSFMMHLDRIGDIKLIQANYSQLSSRYDDYMNKKVLPSFDPDYSGGALYDLNVYNVHFVTGLFGSPYTVQYFANKGFNGIDTSGTLILDYHGFKAILTAAKDSKSHCFTMIQGTNGYIEIDNRPGIAKNIVCYDNEHPEGEVLDTAYEEDSLLNEMLRIRDVIDSHNEVEMSMWMMRTKQCMAVLDQARVFADIKFKADDEYIEFESEY